MDEQLADPVKRGVLLSRPVLRLRDISVASLLFCFIVYFMAALRGIFPATPAIAIVCSLLVLIVLVSLRAVVQLQLSPSRLSKAGAMCLFLSFLAWEAPFDGGFLVILSLLCLALSIGFYLGCSLRELAQSGESLTDSQFFRPILSRAMALMALASLFLLMRWVFGWFLAMRVMLLVPAVVLVLELRQKGSSEKEERLLIRGYLKNEWVHMLAYGLFLAGVVLLFLNLVASFILGLEGQHALQITLGLLLIASVALLKLFPEAYRHYYLSLAAILMLLASAVLYGDNQPMMILWLIITVLVGAALGGGALSFKIACTAREPMARIRLFYVTVIIALLVITAYPICHYALGPQASLILAPSILFLALLVSFFVQQFSAKKIGS